MDMICIKVSTGERIKLDSERNKVSGMQSKY